MRTEQAEIATCFFSAFKQSPRKILSLYIFKPFLLGDTRHPDPSLSYPLGISPGCNKPKPIRREQARNKQSAADREIGETGSAVKSIKMRVWVVGLWFVL